MNKTFSFFNHRYYHCEAPAEKPKPQFSAPMLVADGDRLVVTQKARG